MAFFCMQSVGFKTKVWIRESESLTLEAFYDKESAKGSNWVSQGGESESGQMVLKKWNRPILMHIYAKQCEIMQKINEKAQTVQRSNG